MTWKYPGSTYESQGHHHDGFVGRGALAAEICAGQHDGGERVAAARLGDDADGVAELVVDQFLLRGTGGDDDVVGQAGLADLAHHALDHRFLGAVGGGEEFQELLGADVVRQRPQPLPRPSGQ